MIRALSSVVCAFVCLLALIGSTAAAQERPAEPSIDRRALEAALSHYARVEPSVDEVVRAALDEGATHLSEVEALESRARLSGLLPSVRIGAQRGTGWDLSERLDETGRVQLATDDSLSIRGEAVFALDRLLFAKEEVPLMREERAVHLMRRDLRRTVVHLYYERRRLMLERDLLGATGIAHTLRIQEATALLSAFTGGRFRRMMAGR